MDLDGVTAISDYHYHPQKTAKAIDMVPSEMDFFFWIQSVVLLNQRGYRETYDGRVITPIGMFIVTPNCNLLRENPKRFRELVLSRDYDDLRLKLFRSGFSSTTLTTYLNAVNTEAMNITFIPQTKEQKKDKRVKS
ncbi:MAG: hypothetical protein A3C46_03875 [Deltaproteobacteria bacterium RIFCSPHIGHO2_02_FULL_44_16]|nr:MAG: hypothetical protein A3C46_03875 [Deltaproteobacteria bacterium RIFCSPHIGHO2_02_FULL_44_16]